jgi:hypothetical protein
MNLTIEDLIKEQIQNIDINGLVKDEVRRLVSDDIKRELVKITKDQITKIIETEIDICMSKGVQTDDGWGKKNTYPSFEDMFKKTFAERLNASYDMKSTIERHIKDKVDLMVKAETKQLVDALTKTLTSK